MTIATEQTPPARTWFRAWLKGHQRRNPHKLFVAYEADGGEVYQAWIMAFEETGTTRGEARAASRLLQRKHSIKGLLPEHHLPRLLAILARIQGPRRRRAEEARRAAARAEADHLAALEAEEREMWALLPVGLANGYRATVHRAAPRLANRLPRFAEMLARKLWAAEEAGDVEGAENLLAAWCEESAPDQADERYRRRRVVQPLDSCPEPTRQAVWDSLAAIRRRVEASQTQTRVAV